MTSEPFKLSDLIITNWQQILFFLGFLVIVFTSIMNWIYKKKEIRFNRLHENKITEIKEFYKSYYILAREIKTYYYQTEYGSHDDAFFEKIKLKIIEAYQDFEYHLLIVRLFIKENQLELIENLKTQTEEMYLSISKWHIHKGDAERNKYNDKLNQIGDNIIPHIIPELLKRIENELRKDLI